MENLGGPGSQDPPYASRLLRFLPRLTVWSVEKRLSKDVHALTFGTCEYVVLQGQRDCADVLS